MSLLLRHLDQIQLCSDSIATLPFPPPRIFTNALLSPHDITALIRDTEPHERALFSVPAPTTVSNQPDPEPSKSRRQTVFAVQSGEITTDNTGKSRAAPRRNTAVTAVLGADLNTEIRRNERENRKGDNEVDVEVLLRGAEKLLEVYAMEGVRERITALRGRWRRGREGVRAGRERVDRLEREVERLNRGSEWEEDEEEEADADKDEEAEPAEEIIVTDDDLKAEEEEIHELERRKKELEERVEGMERDLGGLLR